MARSSATLGAFDRRFSLFVEATFNELAAVVAVADGMSTPDITTSWPWAEQAAVPARQRASVEPVSCPLDACMGMNGEGRHPF